jgi:predicted transcriptional regulator
MLLTARQCRAGRAWLGISQEELATRSAVSARTIAHFEAGNRLPHDRTLKDLVRTFEEMGVVFQFEGGRDVGLSALDSRPRKR